jgi:hypothetical protein
MIITWVQPLYNQSHLSLITKSEMSLNLDTISGGIEYECPEGLFFGRLGYRSTKEHLVVDGTKYVLTSAANLIP